MNLSGHLPDDHGLTRIAYQLVTDPRSVRLAVVEFDVSKVVTDTETGARTPTIRLRAIEPVIDASEVIRARELMRRERRRRNALDPMPGQLDLLDELDPDRDPPDSTAMDRLDPGDQ